MTYSVLATVQVLTSKIQGQLRNDEIYNNIVSIGQDEADDTINSALREQMIPIDSVNNPNLASNLNIQQAANLYAAAFVIDWHYTDSKNPNTTSPKYTSRADTKVKDYIDNYWAKNADDGYSNHQSPREAFGGERERIIIERREHGPWW